MGIWTSKRPKQRKKMYMYTICIYNCIRIYIDKCRCVICYICIFCTHILRYFVKSWLYPRGLLFESPVRALFSKGSEFGSPASISTVKSKMFQATPLHIKTGALLLVAPNSTQEKKHALLFCIHCMKIWTLPLLSAFSSRVFLNKLNSFTGG